MSSLAYNKEFKEADFPRLDMFVCVYNQTYPFYDNRHYITKAFFAKDKDHENYKILLHVCGVQTICRKSYKWQNIAKKCR